MIFTPLASSSAGCLYRLDDGESMILIECGLRWARTQELLEHRTPDFVLVSHHHADHARSAGEYSRRGVPVLCSTECAENLGCECQIVAAEIPVRMGGWTIMPFETGSDTPGTLGFLVGRGHDRLVYATDCSHVRNTFVRPTIMAIEANHDRALIGAKATGPHHAHVVQGHMSIDQALALLEANDLSRVREIHLLHLSDEHSDEAEFAARVRRLTGRPTYVAPKGG